jgi:hypothetical protein
MSIISSQDEQTICLTLTDPLSSTNYLLIPPCFLFPSIYASIYSHHSFTQLLLNSSTRMAHSSAGIGGIMFALSTYVRRDPKTWLHQSAKVITDSPGQLHVHVFSIPSTISSMRIFIRAQRLQIDPGIPSAAGPPLLVSLFHILSLCRLTLALQVFADLLFAYIYWI